MTTLSLSDIDPRLGGTPANLPQAPATSIMGGKPAVANETGTQLRLEDIDPRLAAPAAAPPPNAPGAKTKKAYTPTDEGLNFDFLSPENNPAIAGAAASYVLNRAVPKQVFNDIGFNKAKTENLLMQKSASRLADNVLLEAAEHRKISDRIFDSLVKATTTHKATENELKFAESLARKTGIDPNSILPEGVQATGDKWAFGSENIEDIAKGKNTSGATGGQGPGGTSTAEAAANYRLEKTLPSEYKASRTGLAIPSSLESTGPFYNPQQQIAADRLKAAKTAHITSQSLLDSAIAERDAHLKTPQVKARTKNLASTAAENANKAADKLALEQQSRGPLTSFGRTLSNIPGLNVLTGGIAGEEFSNAAKEYHAAQAEKEDAEARMQHYKNMLAHGSVGLGGALMSVPNVRVKAAGALTALPGSAYLGYTSLMGKQNPPE